MLQVSLLLFGLVIISFLVRLLYVLFNTLSKKNENAKKSPQDKVKTLIVIGSGGHTSEMMYIIEALQPERYTPRVYVMASSDSWSEQKIHEYELNVKNQYKDCEYNVFKIPRSRKVHQSYITSVFTTLYSFIVSIPVVFKSKPELLLCNGPGTCIPICVITFLMKCCFISNCTIIFVESICRVRSLSLSGKILQWFADEVLVQWPELTSKYKRTKYIGRVQ